MAIDLGAGQEEGFSAINATPLVDVMLVLLIVFLIAIPTIVSSKAVKLPAYASHEHHARGTHILSIHADGRVYVDDLEVVAASLQAALSQLPARDQVILEIHADRRVPLDRVRSVMESARLAGVSQILFALQPGGA